MLNKRLLQHAAVMRERERAPQRRRAARRAVCTCGTCRLCRQRASMRRTRQRHHAERWLHGLELVLPQPPVSAALLCERAAAVYAAFCKGF